MIFIIFIVQKSKSVLFNFSTAMTHLLDDNWISLGEVPLEEKPLNQRRENRMFAVQFLYAWDLSHPDSIEIAFSELVKDQQKPKNYYQFARELAFGAIEKQEAIDKVILQYAQNWAFNRIPKVDLAILRLAIFELLYRLDIPPIVSINEALDLVSVYSHPDAKRFINGLLDRFKATLQRPIREAVKRTEPMPGT